MMFHAFPGRGVKCYFALAALLLLLRNYYVKNSREPKISHRSYLLASFVYPFFSLSHDATKSKKDCLLLQSYQRRKISRNTLSQILYPETLVLKHLFLVQDSSLLLQVQDIFTKGYNQKTAQSTERILKVLNLLVKYNNILQSQRDTVHFSHASAAVTCSFL